MNKSQLINAVAEKTNLSKSVVKSVVDSAFELTTQQLIAGDKVVISGFGVFSTSVSAERMGRNPRTGEAVRIPTRRSIKFRSSVDIE